MMRFFLDETVPPDRMSIELSGSDAHHLRDVLRVRPGETVVVCDAARTEHRCVILGMDAVRVRLRILERHPARTEPPYEAILFQALAKGDRMDGLIQKSVELGVSRIVPYSGARSVVRLDAEDGRRKAERWSRIAGEAAKQCGRGRIPPVEAPIPFEEAIRRAAEADVAFLPWEAETERTLGAFFREERTIRALESAVSCGRLPAISFLIGPEGGFDFSEVERAVARGLVALTLGPRILRTETAGPVVLAQLSLILETAAPTPI